MRRRADILAANAVEDGETDLRRRADILAANAVEDRETMRSAYGEGRGTQGLQYPNPPSQVQIVRLVIAKATAITQSWAFQTFLASVFECDISINDLTRHTLSLFWDAPDYTWGADAILLRTCYQNLNLNLYNQMRESLRFLTSYKAYPRDNDQEVLLGQFHSHVVGGPQPTFDRNVTELCAILNANLPQHRDEIANLIAIGNRLFDAVTRLQLRFRYYTELFNPPVADFLAQDVIGQLDALDVPVYM